MIDTNESLLDRLKCTEAHDSWQLFYDQYWAVILRYARKLGLNDHQAEEVLQETMVALMQQLPKFSYDRGKGRFRNFLLTIVHRKSLAALRRAKGRSDVSLDSDNPWGRGTLHDLLPDDAIHSNERIAEERWRDAIMEEMLSRLAADPALSEKTWPVFRAYVIDNRPVEEVAAKYQLKENAVYQIKNRILQRLRTAVTQRLRDAQ